jgi:hypothetical protein
MEPAFMDALYAPGRENVRFAMAPVSQKQPARIGGRVTIAGTEKKTALREMDYALFVSEQVAFRVYTVAEPVSIRLPGVQPAVDRVV